MAPNDIDNQRNFWGNLFRRNRNVIEISEPYHGDLDTDQPLRIAPGVTLQGNVRAPEVWIAGLLQGYVLTPKLCVNAGGQLRGDVVAVQVDTELDGKIRGRLTMISADQFQALNRQIAQGSKLMDQGELRVVVAQLLETAGDEEHPVPEDGGATGPVEAMPAAIDEPPIATPLEEHSAVERAQSLQSALDEAEAKIARLEAFQARVEQHPRDPGDARRLLEQREAALVDADEENRDLEQQLTTALRQVDKLKGRVESLESALQASVQHGADQEEALLRWQELAESTKSDVRRLKSEVGQLHSQLEERESDVERLHQALAAQQEEQRRAEASGPDNDSAVTRLETRLIQLEHLLEDAQDEIQEQHDQLLWYRTSQTAIEGQLQASQGQLKEHEEKVAALKQEVENQRALAQKWQDRAGHLSELLYDATQQLKELDLDSVTVADADADSGSNDKAEFKAIRQRLRERETQVESLEMEVARYHEELETQGQRLAEARAALAERQIALEKMRDRSRKRAEELEKIKRVATSRIRRLEAALARLERKRTGSDDSLT